MADSIVGFLLENLSRLVTHEANLLCGVEDKVTSLQSELRMISVFLKCWEENKRNKGDIEQEVVHQIRDAAHEAEDVIDAFVASVTNHRRRSFLPRMLHAPHHANTLHHVAAKIDNIKTTINHIYDNKIKYDTRESAAMGYSTHELMLLHKRRRDVEEEDVVGFHHDSTVVINRLMEGGQTSHRRVVSIIGMGGLGKTTLARKIYNSHEVKSYFDCRAWVYVSNDYKGRELLLTLLNSLISISGNKYYSCSNSNNRRNKKSKGNGKGKHKAKSESRDVASLSEEELKEKVRECLKGMRYLIVLDDIWKTQHWDDLQYTFPDDHNGSRILITSRLKEVASHATPSPPYYLPFLKKDESWELFTKKVFRGEEVPSDLEPLGRQMVESCDGLPLSIVVLAGMLANKDKSQREWSKIMGHVNWYLTQQETQVKDIVLKLSYDSLPSRLKPCFLYFGMFPEDYEILVRRLIQLWVAEGFIQQTGTRVEEDVAEDYLDELIDRSLIQVASRRTDGGVKTCRIHDLLRELCISESKEEKFFQVCRAVDIMERTRPRRLSIHCKISDYVCSSNTDHSGTRSLLCFDRDSYYKMDSGKLKWLVKGCQLVRVLDPGLPLLPKLSIPTNFGVLVHLRYLRLDIQTNFFSYCVGVIPASICNLWNLETLDLGHSRLRMRVAFSAGMWKLKRLRHLHTGGPLILPQFPNAGSETMWNLQTLSWVSLNEPTAAVSLIQRGVFPKLRKLGLYFDKEWKCKQRPADQLLESLRLPNLSHLNTLKVSGISELPTSANAFPFNLTNLTLVMERLNNHAIGTLGNLTNLRILKLSENTLFGYASKFETELRCIPGFPQLEVFQMRYMGIHRWKLAKGAMPRLRRLIIKNCKYLTALPDELWSLTALQEVQVLWPSKPLNLQLQHLHMKHGCNLIIYPTKPN